MKATIDGMVLEGTPKEIHEFKKLRDEIKHDKLWKDLDKKQKPFEIDIDKVSGDSKSDIYTSTSTKRTDIIYR